MIDIEDITIIDLIKLHKILNINIPQHTLKSEIYEIIKLNILTNFNYKNLVYSYNNKRNISFKYINEKSELKQYFDKKLYTKIEKEDFKFINNKLYPCVLYNNYIYDLNDIRILKFIIKDSKFYIKNDNHLLILVNDYIIGAIEGNKEEI